MARIEDKNKAIKMRKSGMSYSQIKAELGVSKSTLSLWLRDLPLSDKRLRELRDFSQVRIEKTRITKLKNKTARRDTVLSRVKIDFAHNKNPLFIGGFYLYWGEGTKSAEYTIALTNTDPGIIKTYLAWLRLIHVDINDCRVKLHLYADQDIKDSIKFWSEITQIPSSHFYKPYIKETALKSKTYRGMFGHGTCSVYYHNRDTYEYVMAGLQILRNQY
jgi:hypothetical protein